MTTSWQTEQEAFWNGDFGDEYVDRNQGAELMASRTHLFSNALKSAGEVGSAVEFGPNIGTNLMALRLLLPKIDLTAIEINEKAVEVLRKRGGATIHHGSILEPHLSEPVDLSFTVGVLIHINPASLSKVYDNLYAASKRLILFAEYYNPAPVSIPYRGHDDRLFKRDFAGDMLERFEDLKLVDYGFQYRRDPKFPADDISWFLMEKRA